MRNRAILAILATVLISQLVLGQDETLPTAELYTAPTLEEQSTSSETVQPANVYTAMQPERDNEIYVQRYNQNIADVEGVVPWSEAALQGVEPVFTSPYGEIRNVQVYTSQSETGIIGQAFGTEPNGDEVKIELSRINPDESEMRFMFRPMPERQSMFRPMSEGQSLVDQAQYAAGSSETIDNNWIVELVVDYRYLGESLTISFAFPERPEMDYSYTIRPKSIPTIDATSTSESSNSGSAVGLPTEEISGDIYSFEFNGFSRTVTGDIDLSSPQTPSVITEISNLVNTNVAQPAIVHAASPVLIGALMEDNSGIVLAAGCDNCISKGGTQGGKGKTQGGKGDSGLTKKEKQCIGGIIVGDVLATAIGSGSVLLFCIFS